MKFLAGLARGWWALGRRTLTTSPADGKKKERARLSPRKGEELLGLVYLLAGLLLGASLVTYHPRDPSLLRHTELAGSVRNLIGPVGANLAALGFGFLGLPALLVSALLLLASWRLLRRHPGPRVVGRGLGGVIVLVALPPLLQTTLTQVSWRGETIDAGGALGRLVARALEGQIGFAGSLLVLLAGVVMGSTLLVQSTLGELLAGWHQRARSTWGRLSLTWARLRERRGREKSRRRVMAKHLQRVIDERHQRQVSEEGEEAPATPDLPLRVTERRGEGAFSVRRVAVPAAMATANPPPRVSDPEPAAPPSEPARVKGQPKLPFALPELPAGGALPPINLLSLEQVRPSIEENELVRLGEVIRSRCAEFGVEGTIEGISPGPVITIFEFQPAPGVKVSQIVSLQDELALVLKAEAVRIERLAGRSTLGVEVPNKQRAVIRLGHLLAQETFRRSPSLLTMAIGTTIHGEPYYADLATMPHLLVAGATGSGKSVGLQSMITSILYKARRDEVQFIFIDPKRIELGVYADIPHLKTEVVVEPKKAANALRWAVGEMERRYRLLAEVHVRNIDHYNRAVRDPQVQERLALADGDSDLIADDVKPLPYYVVVIDELADLMMTSSAEVEAAIARLAQMARAVGLHLIVATQRPSVDVLTGTIKANFPCRMAFASATRHDSRTILDQIGAEKLLGRGDMLFMPPGTSRLIRLHGAYVSEQETAGLIRWLKKQGKPDLDPAVLAAPDEARQGQGPDEEDDELFAEAARMVVAERQASASFLQRRMRIGFSRAARLIDLMERDGLLGPPQGSKPREVLVKPDFFSEWERARRHTGD